jgi:hypothetical protein
MITRRQLIPPLIGELNSEPEMTLRLATLITHVTMLHALGLKDTHCQRVHPLPHPTAMAEGASGICVLPA